MLPAVGVAMFDTIDGKAQQDEPRNWKDLTTKIVIALVLVGVLAGGLYLSVGN